jgi:DoxX-like family
MNIGLWVLQGLLAFVFLASGILKLVLPREKLAVKAAWASDFSAAQVKWIGLAEALGAMGMVAPTLTGIAPMLTPLAAVGLVAIMIGAVATHVRREEPPTPPIILGVLAAIVAIGRLAMAPLNAS